MPSKRGLGWPWDMKTEHFAPYTPAIQSQNLTWLFNWELWKPDGCPDSLEYVPQVRTANEVSQIDGFLGDQIKRFAIKHLLGFNEPDIESQAHMSVADAVKLWHSHVEPAKAKYHLRLGSPGISSAPAGKVWLSEFMASDAGKEVDFVVCHWYGTDVGEFGRYLRDMYDTFKKPLWVNEFAFSRFGAPTEEEECARFVEESVRLLEGEEFGFVERYAYFGTKPDGFVGRGSSFTGEGTGLTGVGRKYVEL